MANYLDANPKVATQLDAWRDYAPDLVPVCRNGGLLGFFSRPALDLNPLPTPLPIKDYIVGLELLGHRFFVSTDGPGPHLYIMEPEHSIPPAWRERELTLMSGRNGRTEETIAFLLSRDGGPTLSRHRSSGGRASNAA